MEAGAQTAHRQGGNSSRSWLTSWHWTQGLFILVGHHMLKPDLKLVHYLEIGGADMPIQGGVVQQQQLFLGVGVAPPAVVPALNQHLLPCQMDYPSVCQLSIYILQTDHGRRSRSWDHSSTPASTTMSTPPVYAMPMLDLYAPIYMTQRHAIAGTTGGSTSANRPWDHSNAPEIVPNCYPSSVNRCIGHG